MCNKEEVIKNNSEILFIYDAKMTNPNGDPDDENKPRMDYDRSRNIVSDVRLKRYIRDYLLDYEENVDVFVRRMGNKVVDATNRLKQLISDNEKEICESDLLKKDLLKKNKDKLEPQVMNLGNHLDWLLGKLIDVRFFGATIPIKAKTGSGSSITFTGPIQFNWGYSLNKVFGVYESNAITSTFSGASENHSTMGKDYRVAYSILAFHGIVSAKRAIGTCLKIGDLELFDRSIINSILLEATTRSKTGQEPLLYIRVEYNNDNFFIGDLRKYVKLANNYNGEIPFYDLANSERSKAYLYATDTNGDPYSPSWYTLNLRSQYAISDAFKGTISIENITNQRYRTYSSGIAAPGTNFILGLGYRF